MHGRCFLKLVHNVSLHDIQFFAPMDNSQDKIIINISKGVENNILSNDDLLQIFEY